jgi:hypothetical protein
MGHKRSRSTGGNCGRSVNKKRGQMHVVKLGGTLVSMAVMLWRCLENGRKGPPVTRSHTGANGQCCERGYSIAHGPRGYHKYTHANVSAASPLLNCHIDAHHPTSSPTTMGNTHSQNPSPHRIQKLHDKIAAKLPAGRAKDSGYRSGSASSSGTAVKGARAHDQTNSTVVSTGSGQGSTPRPEATPAAAEKHRDAPAQITETVCRNDAIYGRTN